MTNNKQLRQSEKIYRLLFESMTEGFLLIEMILDDSGNPISYRYLDANPALERLTRLKREEIIGKDVREVLPGIEPHWIEAFGRVAMTGEPAHIEQFNQDLNGWFNVYIYCPEPGKAALIYTNVTERKQAEETLRETRRNYEELFRYAPAGIYEVDFRKRRFISVNEAMCRMLGYSREEVLLIDPFDITDEAGRACFQSRITKWLGGEEPDRNVEYKITTKDGRTLVVILDITFTVDEDGNPLGATVIAHDITERKRAEDELQKRTLELQQLTDTLEHRVEDRTVELVRANKRLRRLSSKLITAQEDERRVIAEDLHDSISSELAAIKIHLQMAYKDWTDSQHKDLEELTSLVQTCINEVRRIMTDLRPSMLDDLGLLSTFNWYCDKFKKTYPHIDLDCKYTVKEKEIPETLKIVLYRILQEGLNNIAKHSEADLAAVCLKNRDGILSFEITDNGRGFDPTRTSEGMGLSSMRGRAEHSQGVFSVDSAPGEMTRIHCTWSLDPASFP